MTAKEMTVLKYVYFSYKVRKVFHVEHLSYFIEVSKIVL